MARHAGELFDCPKTNFSDFGTLAAGNARHFSDLQDDQISLGSCGRNEDNRELDNLIRIATEAGNGT